MPLFSPLCTRLRRPHGGERPVGRAWAAVVVLVVLGLLAVGCADVIPSERTDAAETTSAPDPTEASDTTVSPDTTDAPDTTESPDTTDAPDTTASPDPTTVPTEAGPVADDGTEGLGLSSLWAVVGLVVLLIVVGWVMGRSRRPSSPDLPAQPTWKDHLRAGYGEARWLNDAMTEDVGIWRGNSLAGPKPSVAGPEMTDRWDQLESRLDRARQHLYTAEASAPDQAMMQQIRDTVDRLNSVRSSLDSRIRARLEASTEVGDPTAAERERLTSTSLAESRAALAQALESLAGLL